MAQKFGFFVGMTHAGVFHADDVLSAVVLRVMNPEISIVRVARVPTDVDTSVTLVFDVGCGEFDHHQADAALRPEGGKYAALGLIWRTWGAEVVKTLYHQVTDEVAAAAAAAFDRLVVAPADWQDNNGQPKTDMPVFSLSSAVSAFVPAWNSTEAMDEAFVHACDFARQFILAQLNRCVADASAEADVLAAAAACQGNVLVLNQYMPWQAALRGNETIKFVVFPSLRGGYSVTGNGHLFPAAWAAKRDQELAEISGVTTANFCHQGRFMASAATVEDAVRLAELALSAEAES